MEPSELAPGIILEWLSGYCPVQAEGTIDGIPFYFRARHDTISLSIGLEHGVLDPDWEWCELYLDQGEEDAGYLPHADARRYIVAFGQYYQQQLPGNGKAYWGKKRRERLQRIQQEHPEYFKGISEDLRTKVDTALYGDKA